MKSSEFDKDLEVTPFITSLTEKTASGGLNWEPTAQADTFIASLAGSTLRIRLEEGAGVDMYDNPTEAPVLYILDEKGKTLWQIYHTHPKGGLWGLYRLVQRIANKVDDRMASLMEALQRL